MRTNRGVSRGFASNNKSKKKNNMSALDMMPDPGEEPTAPARFVAIHTYTSAEDGDLSFTKDDILVVTESEGDWWMGSLESEGLTGTIGSFPASYVQAASEAGASSLPHDPTAETMLIAVHDFHSTEEGDLTFNKGDKLVGVELEGDWWTGKNPETGATGSFPSNYVATDDAAHDAAHAAAIASAANAVETRLVALHDFQSTEAGDLSFKKDDVLWGITLEDSWWQGRNDAGEMGSFPSNYTKAAPAKTAPVSVSVSESDPSNAGDKKEEEKAALRIQSIQRGKKARADVSEKKQANAKEKEQQEKAALKIESTYRGNEARKQVKKKRAETIEKDKQEKAALKIESTYRGNKARKQVQEKRQSSSKQEEDKQEEDKQEEEEQEEEAKLEKKADSSNNTSDASDGGDSTSDGGGAERSDGGASAEDALVLLPTKEPMTVAQITSMFNSWDTDGDEVLTMLEFTTAMKDPKIAGEMPALQLARIMREIEKAEEDDQNIEWQYWDINEFVAVLQTPMSDGKKKSKKKSSKKLERRWASKVANEEQADGTIRKKHVKGSVALCKDEFIERYHGTKEWDSAKVRILPSQAKREREKLQKKAKKDTNHDMLSVDELEQIRIRLRQRCTTHNGVDVGQILKRRRWPVDRSKEDEDGHPLRVKVDYETLKDACQAAMKSRLGTDKQFAGFWVYLQTEEKDKCTYEEFTRFVVYKPRRKVARKKSVAIGNNEAIANFSKGFRPDSNEKSTAFVGKETIGKLNPVLVAFREMLVESSWKEELLRDHFRVFDVDGDGSITREEFRIGFDSLSIPHEQRDLQLIIDILDKNHDGVIDYEEFTTQIFEDPEQLLAELAAKKAAEKEAAIQAEAAKKLESNVATSAKPVPVSDENLMSIDDLEQIRIRLRQKCTTFRGIEVNEAFPHRHWPGKGDEGLVSYSEMRTHMQNIFPKRLGGVDNDWSYPSFWEYLATEAENGCSKDEFTRFVSFIAEAKNGKRVMRRKSVATGHAAVSHNFSDGFRPDTNSSEKVSKANAKKTDDSREKRSRIQEAKDSWETAENPVNKGLLTPAEKEKNAPSLLERIEEEQQKGNKGEDKKGTPPSSPSNSGKRKNSRKDLSEPRKFVPNGQSLVANMKAASFSKKLIRKREEGVKFARKIGDNKLDDDEVKMIKKKIMAASYKKGGADLDKLFNEWDKDQSKTLDYGELAQAVARLLPKNSMLSRIEMQQLCKKFDSDGDGNISVEEFKAFLKIEYTSKRKKRGEFEEKEFKSQASQLNSVFSKSNNGKEKKEKKVEIVKRPKMKKAQWRTMKNVNEEEKGDGNRRDRGESFGSGGDDVGGGGGGGGGVDGGVDGGDTDDVVFPGDGDGGRKSKDGTDGSIPSGSEDEWEGGDYDAQGRKSPRVLVKRKRKISTTKELENALKAIPKPRQKDFRTTSQNSTLYLGDEKTVKTGDWFADSDSEDEMMLVEGMGELQAPRFTEPNITAIVRNRRNNMETTVMKQYTTSWDEPGMPQTINGTATDSNMERKTRASGKFKVPTGRAREDKSEWFDESEEGAKHMLDTGNGGDIDVTLYRRQWDDRQPGDGSEANPWRVAVKTEWTGEIAAPSWPTQNGTWVYVPNPPKKYALSHHQLSLNRAFKRGVKTGEGEKGESPRQRKLKKKNVIEIEHQKSTVSYHAMQRLNMQNAHGESQPWNTRQEISVPERPPTHNPEWERRLQGEPVRGTLGNLPILSETM